jgi:hypothetical protein
LGEPVFPFLERVGHRIKGQSRFFPFPVEERLSRGGWGIDRGRLSPYNGPRILVRKGGGERREEEGAGWSKALGLLEPFGIEKLERR